MGPPGYDSIEWIRCTLDTCTVLVLTWRGQDVGGVVVSLPGPGWGRISRLWLVPHAQGLGLGTLVLRRIEELFEQVRVWSLDTPVWNSRNQHFYAREGFVERGRTQNGLINYEKLMSAEL
jgi:GNAT superfamily N-acetyltransferase